MPSIAFQKWRASRAAALDRIEEAHGAVGGDKPGRRIMRQQLNQFYAVTLSSQFQGFCRDFHTECAKLLVAPVSDPNLRQTLYVSLVSWRRLDTGNPNPGNIGADFKRLGLDLWPPVDTDHPRNPQSRGLLEELNAWRNAIAHESFAPAMLKGGRVVLPLARVRRWRKACDGLARSFDTVLRAHLLTMTGVAPW